MFHRNTCRSDPPQAAPHPPTSSQQAPQPTLKQLDLPRSPALPLPAPLLSYRPPPSAQRPPPPPPPPGRVHAHISRDTLRDVPSHAQVRLAMFSEKNLGPVHACGRGSDSTLTSTRTVCILHFCFHPLFSLAFILSPSPTFIFLPFIFILRFSFREGAPTAAHADGADKTSAEHPRSARVLRWLMFSICGPVCEPGSSLHSPVPPHASHGTSHGCLHRTFAAGLGGFFRPGERTLIHITAMQCRAPYCDQSVLPQPAAMEGPFFCVYSDSLACAVELARMLAGRMRACLLTHSLLVPRWTLSDHFCSPACGVCHGKDLSSTRSIIL
ncbi:hypothetical protein HYPSUDRAFT_1026066 [Hypholoma sublateritium FD-334 SS-4]|uniref:Uncharacterized protein n=1 Tax=Hypholoma sublateritium (strain FD-334 SS-4) TaxID=945553 RepID=A0A0D2NL20_HYPSF|nr:hypothetical protein HYPSUDRAFT_1026066 [Hypholoma sublateritium FD-334 SS-4]